MNEHGLMCKRNVMIKMNECGLQSFKNGIWRVWFELEMLWFESKGNVRGLIYVKLVMIQSKMQFFHYDFSWF